MADKKTIWEKSDSKALEAFCEEFRLFLSEHKTERPRCWRKPERKSWMSISEPVKSRAKAISSMRT